MLGFSEWTPWVAIYNKEGIKVELQFKLSTNSCEQGGITNKFRYKITGELKSYDYFINWKMDYYECNGNLYYQQNSINIGRNGSLGIIEAMDYMFTSRKLENSFYEVIGTSNSNQAKGIKINPVLAEENEAAAVKAAANKVAADKAAVIKAAADREAAVIKAAADREAAAKDKLYADAIKEGDIKFSLKDYTTARSKYSDASGIKPSEQYPKDRMKACDDALGSAAKDKVLAQKKAARLDREKAKLIGLLSCCFLLLYLF